MTPTLSFFCCHFPYKTLLRGRVHHAEPQVDCLIDLATDPDVLGRQWIGLTTWV